MGVTVNWIRRYVAQQTLSSALALSYHVQSDLWRLKQQKDGFTPNEFKLFQSRLSRLEELNKELTALNTRMGDSLKKRRIFDE